MEQPKFQVGQQVETRVGIDFHPVNIREIHATYTYTVEEPLSRGLYRRNETEIRPPRPTEEEAWEKAAMVIGRRGYLRLDYCCMNSSEAEDFDRETRHQVYKILVTAGVKFTDEVKDRVRKLIVLDNNL